jgi:hypothetical protein
MKMKEFVMMQEDMDELLKAMKPVPLIMLQCGHPPSRQEMANAAWDKLGKKMGFIGSSVKPFPGKSKLHFLAEPRS